MTVTILPPRLHPGDTVGIIHPAGPVRDVEAFETGLQILRKLDLRIRHYRPDGSGADYLAADDGQRVHELHTVWGDEEVKAVMTARGGYGCLRIMGSLDLDFLRARPKWLIGFSDLTVLLNGIYAKTGLITLHGPGVTSLPRIDSPSLDRFKELIGGEFRDRENIAGLEILSSGNEQGQRASGQLVGGNLTTLTHLVGTPWLPRFDGNILFLEDTAEIEYKLDRMLTHLSCCGLLDNLAGLILGVFDPGHDDRLETLRLNEHIWNRALELTEHFGYPVWGGFPIGHQRENQPLPIGMKAIMDSAGATLQLLPQVSHSNTYV